MAVSTDQQSRFKKRALRFFWVLVVIPFLLLGLALLLASLGVFGALPDTKDLENPKSNLATEVFASDTALLGKYFLQNRTNARFEELSPYLAQALVATEDERYYDHSGIDLRSLIRAVTSLGGSGGASTISQQLSKMLFTDETRTKLKRVPQKLKEWIIAVRLERQYTKNEIIAMYLNRFDFINNAVGIKSASLVYFNKNQADLKIEEAAVLVGMAKNPSLYNPLRFPENSVKRRNVVFAQMMRNNVITREEFDSLKTLPLELDYKVVDHKEGLAPYFREVLRLELMEMFDKKDADGNYVYHKPDGSPYNIYKDGLKVYTTLDFRLQEYAEWAMKQYLGTYLQEEFFDDVAKRKHPPFSNSVPADHVEAKFRVAMKRSERYAILSGIQCNNCGRRTDIEKVTKGDSVFYYCSAEDCLNKQQYYPKDSIEAIFHRPTNMNVFTWKGKVDTLMSPMDSIRYYMSFLQSGMMSMDPKTGFIKAWVGGIDYNYFKYDHVKQSKRQVGSTIKPFVYFLAMQNGYSPCYEIPNEDVTIHKGTWDLIKDWTPRTQGYNFNGEISLKFALANSMNNGTAWIMKQIGPYAVAEFCERIGISGPIKPVPSLCLGVEDVSLYDMVGAYSTFANKGLWIKPSYLRRIEDKNGNVIVDFVPESREVMTEESAYIMLSLMKGVVDGVYNKSYGKRSGTALRLRSQREYAGFRTPIAAKTGTTQENSDGWFIGVTPDLVTGVWVGAEFRDVHFRFTNDGQGANTALPIWGYYMNKVYKDSTVKISKGDFEKPEKRISIELDCDKYNNSNSFNTGSDEPSFIIP